MIVNIFLYLSYSQITFIHLFTYDRAIGAFCNGQKINVYMGLMRLHNKKPTTSPLTVNSHQRKVWMACHFKHFFSLVTLFRAFFLYIRYIASIYPFYFFFNLIVIWIIVLIKKNRKGHFVKVLLRISPTCFHF